VTVDVHTDHRPYLAALADGELELVPVATRAHVDDCDQCRAELEAHQLLGRRLRAAARSVAPVPAAGGASTRRFLLPLAAAAAVAIAIGGAFLATRPATPDPLAAAVLVANQQPEYASADPVEIARWCTVQYGNRVPVVALPGLTPTGARMDWPHDQGVATVTYTLDRETVHVSWLSVAEGGAQPEVVTVGGKPAVLVRKHGITALISGTATQPELVHVAQEVAAVL
jgi:hypothetical protein